MLDVAAPVRQITRRVPDIATPTPHQLEVGSASAAHFAADGSTPATGLGRSHEKFALTGLKGLFMRWTVALIWLRHGVSFLRVPSLDWF